VSDGEFGCMGASENVSREENQDIEIHEQVVTRKMKMTIIKTIALASIVYPFKREVYSLLS
jgi:hypothetical protein